MMRTILAVILPAVLAGSVCAEPRLRVTGQTMGTYYAVTIDSPGNELTEDGLRVLVETRLKQINEQMSTWDDASDISRFNRSASVEWQPVGSDFVNVVQEALRIFRLSDGAFDPTVAPLIDLWGFGKAPRPVFVPTRLQVSEVLKRVGMQDVEVRTDPPAVRKRRPDVQLNLSAIAKGYAVDAVADVLAQAGHDSFMVDIGGETRAGAAKSDGTPWKVGIEAADASAALDRSRPLRIVRLTEMALATSGDYRNFFQADGITYSHTIDPVTGYPVKNPPASVSVLAPSCMTADGLATALMVLGPERGLELARREGVSVLFQLRQADGTIELVGSGRLAGEAKTAGPIDRQVSETVRGRSSEWWVVFTAAGVVFLLAVTGMAVGVMLNRRAITGSCGGLAALPGSDGRSACELCSVPREDCVNEQLRKKMQAAAAGETSEDDS